MTQAGKKILLDAAEGENILARGSEHDEDLITVKAGESLEFMISDYESFSDVKVFVDFKEADIEISESGTFIIPAERVHDDFVVSVRGSYHGIESESDEVYIEAE